MKDKLVKLPGVPHLSMATENELKCEITFEALILFIACFEFRFTRQYRLFARGTKEIPALFHAAYTKAYNRP